MDDASRWPISQFDRSARSRPRAGALLATGRVEGHVVVDVALPFLDSESIPGGGTDPLNVTVYVHLPQPHGLVIAAGGQGAPIRTKHHRVDRAGVASQGLTQRRWPGGIGHVPQ